VVLTVRNDTAASVEIATVRLAGQVMGLTFYAYDTSVSFKVAPGAVATYRFALRLIGLEGQATGLIGSSISVLDAGQHPLASENLVVDVRGSLASVYGLFGLAVLVLTLLAFLGVLFGLARHRLPVNRFRRSLRFLVPGVGLGLFLGFTLSATRVFVPQPGRWVPLVIGSAAVLFGLGYLTPSPEQLDHEELEVVTGPEPAALAAGAVAELVVVSASDLDPAEPGALPPADPELAGTASARTPNARTRTWLRRKSET
jgi:hypothetical protein